MKTCLIVRSDGHSGHREGHCSPDTELAEELGCSTRTAYDILESMVNDGRATVREKEYQGRKVYRYQEDRL